LEDLDPIEVARQLTLIEYSIFKGIQPKEFLNQGSEATLCIVYFLANNFSKGWNKSKKHITSPNILSMIKLFNKVISLFFEFKCKQTRYSHFCSDQ